MTDSTTLNLLTSALNNYLALDPEAPEKLTAFDGRVIAIDITGPNKTIYLLINGSRISAVKTYDREPDATITGSPAALFKLGVHRDSAPLFFAGEVEIRGDTRLGRQFKSLLAEMEIDWEEHLSRFVGDIAAHRIAGLFNDLRKWSKSAADNFADDVGEYLQEESRDVVSGAEMEMFNQQVDKLRDDTERLKARIDRLPGIDRQ
jgi:ubiquinone biosynthesis accessory factor UbiJ